MIAAMMCTAGCGENDALKIEDEELASEAVESESANVEGDELIEYDSTSPEEGAEEEYSGNGGEYPEEETEGVSHEEVGATESGRGISESVQTNAVKTVWVGKTGTKYHKENCRTLRGMKREITLEEALLQGREACKVCGG